MTGICNGLGINAQPRTLSAADILAARIISLFPVGLTTLIIGDDAVGGEVIDYFRARVGGHAMPVSTARAASVIVNGRRGGLFSANAAAMGYGLASGQKTQIAVARWTDSLPFPGYNAIIGGQSVPRLIGYLGQSTLLMGVETIYRDGAASVAVDGGLHIWEASSATTGAFSRQIGCADTTPSNNHRGEILFALQASNQITADQRAGIKSELKSYYSTP